MTASGYREDAAPDARFGVLEPLVGDTVVPMLHELWVNGEGEKTFCLAGPHGDDARRLAGPDSRLVWTVEALSHFDAMTKYHEHMGWGTYTTEYPEWDCVSYAEHGWE